MKYGHLLITAATTLAMVSCGGGESSRPTDTHDYSSHIEFDQNTDPRITVRGQNGEIADIWPAGSNVFVNGNNLTRRSPLDNYAFVRTGSNSAARIDIYRTQGVCGVEVSEFKIGKMYGDTNRCRHEVRTEHSVSNASPGDTEYHIDVRQGATILTVVSGSVMIWPIASPAQAIELQSGAEVRVNRNNIRKRIRVSERDIYERIKWRDQYQYESSGESQQGMGTLGKVLIGIGAAIITKEVYDRSRDDDDPPPSSSQPEQQRQPQSPTSDNDTPSESAPSDDVYPPSNNYPQSHVPSNVVQ